MSSWFETLESRQFLSGTPHLVLSNNQMVFEQVQGHLTAPQTLILKNTGSKKLTIKSLTLAGADAGQFIVTGIQRRAISLGRGSSVRISISFMPYAAAVAGAMLQVATNDPTAPLTSIALRGLGAMGLYGDDEPSLQRILDTFQIPIRVGTSNPAVRNIDGVGQDDQISLQFLKKAGAGPVTVLPLALFAYNTDPVATVGWYTHDSSITAHPLFSVPLGGGQALQPPVSGVLQFDPAAATFGLFANWPSATHAAFSEDALNPWYTLGNGHAVRTYPYKTPSGQAVPNAYVVAMEQGSDPDFQDAVFLVQNVMPAF